MVNKVKEIVNRLDGYSDSGLAFAVTEVNVAEVNASEVKKADGMYYLTVTPYNKDGSEVTEEQHTEELAEMVYRLSGYKGTKYVVINAILLAFGDWNLTVTCYEKKDSKEEQ